ncbi:MAG TPA: hypothetical protein VFK80_09005, partial [Limnochordia bacterium]|nr:hypothetical protein [Limnochordia bacterium]
MPRRIVWALCLVAALWPAGARAGPMGLNLLPAKLQPSAVPALFALARATGADSVRIPFDWSTIDPAPGAHLFARFDEITTDAARANLDVVGVLGPSVAWASPGDPQHFAAPWQRSIYLPGSLDDWSEYVDSVVTRYRDQVH